jgi:DEAD/DEAH box helicase domain-containing protein
VISHPALAEEGVYPPALAELIYEAYLLLVPFDRQDIGWTADFLRQPRPPYAPSGQPFLVVFDQTYGSLRLSGRLLEPGLLGQVLLEACMLASEMEQLNLNAATRAALGKLALEALTQPAHLLQFSQSEPLVPAGWEKVVMPESKGLLMRSNEEFRVVRIFQTPMGICYEGVPASLNAAAATTVMPQLSDVAEIPGESQMGLYDPQSGELQALPGGEMMLMAQNDPPASPALYSPELAAERLAAHCEINRLARIAARLGIVGVIPGDRAGLARLVAAGTDPAGLVSALLEE